MKPLSIFSAAISLVPFRFIRSGIIKLKTGILHTSYSILTANILFCVITLNLDAQTISTDELSKVNKELLKANSLAIDMIYTVYAGHSTQQPLQIEKGIYLRKGDKFYSKLLGIETLISEGYFVLVYSEDQTMVIGPSDKINSGNTTPVDIQKSLSMCNKIEEIKSGKNQKAYKIFYKSTVASEYDAAEIYYNKTNYIIEKMVLYYRSPMRLTTDSNLSSEMPRLEIEYTAINTSPSLKDRDFSTQNFFDKKGSGYTPALKYKNYRIINKKNT